MGQILHQLVGGLSIQGSSRLVPIGVDFAHQRSFRFVSRKVGVLRRGLAAVAEVVEEAAGSDIGFNTVGH